MLVVISPAKKLNTTLSNDVLPSKPQFSTHAIELASVCLLYTSDAADD